MPLLDLPYLFSRDLKVLTMSFFRALSIFAGILLLGSAWGVLAAEKPKQPTAKKAGKTDPQHTAKMKQGLTLFKKSVRQVLLARCAGCHGGEETEGEFDITTREGLLKGGTEGKAVVLGQAKKSRLYRLIAHLDEPVMPVDGAKLSDIAIAEIVKWIDLGAPYDGPLVKSADPNAWITERVSDEAKQFWSFLPLKRQQPPQVKNEKWVRTPLDRFVLAKLESKGLTPNAPVDRRHLIRRAYFDLLGLPPTPAEVDAFVNDKDPQAYEKLLDRLLESPHYGERWARHWLDVARFGESHGFEQDYDRPHAYHFRDFVIKAFNQDMPYDQFVRWQLAGDEIAPNQPLAMMATGFLGAGVFPTQLTEKEFEPARYDELDDMVNTLGTSMLGLTIGCARCHDHKFDPLPSADYYRLVATFATTIRSNIDLELNPEETRKALSAWEKEHQPLAASLEKFEQQQLPDRFEKWLATRKRGDNPPPAWMVLDFTDYKSQGGATLAPQEDGSLLATGKNPDFDKYTLTAQTNLQNITAIRLEALSHKSMAKGGPGRAGNGNIGLSNFTVTATPLNGQGKAVTVKLKNARATFQQNTGSLSIAASIDGDKKSGWAVDPQFGKDQAAIFELAGPIGFAGGTKLTFTLEFNVNNKHNIGRPRLAISTSATPAKLGFQEDTGRQAVVEVLSVLDTSGGKLNDAQRKMLLTWYRGSDAEWQKLNAQVLGHLQKKPKPKTTKVMITSEGVKPIPHHADGRGFPHFYKETFYLKRGDATQKHGAATPSFLQVLSRAPEGDKHWQLTPPKDSHTSYRRRSLANWITDVDYGPGHLVARVMVNRLWQHHLGRGIAATPNDFGYQGLRPTHPELLDYLAGELVDGGWRLKRLHKLIMTSAVYVQGSQNNEANSSVDPDNQWWWRRSPRRLEAEVIRDAMLALGGQLDETMYGPGSLDQGHKRRSIYFMIKRSRLVPMMQLFDSPEPLVSQGQRPSTTIAPQALMFMNSPYVRGYASGFAGRLSKFAENSTSAAVSEAYRMALGREPSKEELQDGVTFVDIQTKSYIADKKINGRQLALTDFCQVLMSVNEFVYVE